MGNSSSKEAGLSSCTSTSYASPSTEQLPDKYKTYDELEHALREAGIESMQLVVGFDFSKSNEWTGDKSYHKNLHGLDYVNPYMRVLNILEPIIPRFDDDGIIPAFRFGCMESRDQTVLPLCAPMIPDPHFQGFAGLREGYVTAVKNTRMSGPTTFAPMIYQTIEIEKAYGGHQLLILIIITDGDVSNVELDRKAIIEASKYPISICAIGLGDGPFTKMVDFDDFEGGRLFDNFQFVDFTKFEVMAQHCENPELALATLVFNEVPDHFMAMKRLGYL